MVNGMNRVGPVLLLVIVASASLAGCLSDDADPVNADDQADQEDAVGNVTVSVLDAATIGVGDVTVVLEAAGENRTETTNPLGLAKFNDVPVGEVRIQAGKEGFVPANVTFTLQAGQHAKPELTLESTTAESYVDEYVFEGLFECSMTYLIITGDCLVLAQVVSDETGVPMPVEGTNEQFIFDFQVQDGWSSIRITQEWDEPDFALGSMMRVNLEPHAPNETEHNDRYARAEGDTPISLNVTQGEPHPTASEEDFMLGAEGGLVQTRSFHLGLADAHNPGGSEFLGTGIAYQQRFTVSVEIHYGP